MRVKLPARDNANADPSVPGGFVNNYLTLGPSIITVIGGRVPDLADKWELMQVRKTLTFS